MPGEKKDANESDDEYEVERVVDYQFCKETVRRGKKTLSASWDQFLDSLSLKENNLGHLPVYDLEFRFSAFCFNNQGLSNLYCV